MDQVRESIGILGEALGLLGGILSFLGATGIVLFVLSLILLAIVGAFSPLPKMINYVAIVVLVTALAMFGIEGFGELPGRVEALRGYLIVMLSPVVGVFLLKAVIGALFRRRSETDQLREAVTELTEQVAQLRRDRKSERSEAMLTIEAKAEEPKLLRRLDRTS